MSTQAARSWRSERSGGFAVLLNANAKQVDGRVRSALAELVDPADLFFSRSLDEARGIADTVVARRYPTVFTGGGDGTFVGWVNHIGRAAERRSAPLPRFGVLALGTGNAVAGVVGARPAGHLQDLATFRRARANPVRRLALLSCEGRRTPFAGLGLDAAVLEDYGWLKSRLGQTGLRGLATGLSGYALSIALRSAPRQLGTEPAYCEILNAGRPAFRIDARGHQAGPAIGPGEVLYAGPCTLAAAGTVPFYGFGLKAFPYAETRPGYLQLKVVTGLPLAALLTHLSAVWDGTFSHPSILDFHAERVSVRFDRPMPLQIGGDAEGRRSHVELAMSSRPVELVDFTALRRLPHAVS